MTNTKKVNIILQCLATLCLPIGLYAFKRINKLKAGGIVYVISIVVGVVGIVIGSFHFKLFLNITTLSMIVSYFIPIIFMKEWCKKWNKSITFERVS